MAQLQKGTTYITGDQVTAANLNALVDSGILTPGAITDQTAKTVPLAADTILLHSAADTALRKTTMTQLFATPQPLGATTPSSVAATTGTFSSTLGVTGVATLGNGAILGTPASGTVTNLTGTASININGTVGATTPSTVAATTGTFSSYVVGAGTNPGSLGGSKWIYDWFGGNHRQFSMGADASTNGAWAWYSQRSDGTNSVVPMTLTSTGLNSTAIGATTPAAGSFTTLKASGMGVNATPSSLGTTQNWLQFTNTGGDLYFGQESSVAAAFFSGSSAYATVIYSPQPVQTIIGGTKRLDVTSSGAAITGTLSCTTGANFATSSGSVGIATTIPNYLLTVKGTSSASTPIISVTDAVSASGKHLKLGLDTSTGSGFGWLQYTHEGTAHEKIKINPSGGSVELCNATTVASSTGLAITGTQTITSTSSIKLTLNGGTNQNGIQLETSPTTGTHAFYIASGSELIVGGDKGFAIMDATSSYAGRFFIDAATGLTKIYAGLEVTGALSCTGALSKGSGSFRIEHPLPSKSATHQLVHSFIEGPKCDLIYRGKVDLVDGKASVNIDTDSTMTEGTFEALCATVQCFTSNESGWGAIRGKVIGNILTIEAQDAASTDNVSWMVIGERKDPHIMDTDWTDKNGRPIVEPLKPAEPALESK